MSDPTNPLDESRAVNAIQGGTPRDRAARGRHGESLLRDSAKRSILLVATSDTRVKRRGVCASQGGGASAAFWFGVSDAELCRW